MNDDLAGYGRGRNNGLPLLRLAIVVALHLLMFALWRLGVPAAPSDHADRPAIVYLRAPKPAPPQNAFKTAPPQPALRVRVAKRIPYIVAQPAPPMAVVAPAPAPEPEPEPPPAPPADAQPSLAERARAGAGRADRELRAGEPKVAGAAPLVGPDKFAVALEAAFKPRSTTIEEIPSADGRRISRVTGRGFSYCIVEEANQLVRGNDIFKDKRGKQVSCPK
ncbi:MAG: hypothetical protein V4857_26215 [Pseudomonadota bacterium]